MSRTMMVIIIGVAFATTTQITHTQSSSTSTPVSSQLTFMGFRLGSNTLAEVQNTLGAAPAGSCSEGEEASKVICYVSDGPDRTKVFFKAGFSGGWSRLDGVRVVGGNSTSPNCRLQCVPTEAVKPELQTQGGLKLGLTRQELTGLLGPSTTASGNRLRFEWHSKTRMTKEEIEQESRTFKAPVTDPYWDVTDTIDVGLENSRVAEFEIRHLVTY